MTTATASAAVTTAARAVSAFARVDAAAELTAGTEYLRDVYQAMPGAVLVVDPVGVIQSVNDAALALLEAKEGQLCGLHLRNILDGVDLQDAIEFEFLRTVKPVVRAERTFHTSNGDAIPVLFSASPMVEEHTGRVRRVVCVALDLRERKRLELELRHAQKLEAVGRLAAGIAHEINTPVQFIGDGIHFLQGAFQDLLALIGHYRTLLEASGGAQAEALLTAARQAEEQADLEYLAEQVPKALDRTLDGVSRVAGIVRAMRDFSHPDRSTKAPADLDKAIQNTLTVARSEYKYVADVETDLVELPPVPCHLGELNQVILNLVVNAAHAISDALGPQGRERGERGLIRVRTALLRQANAVEISVSDSGCGIPESIAERVFEPFFTTKEVGRGTGQGLAIAHSIVVEKHGGTLTFETELGRGTTFFIRLPLEDRASFGESLREVSLFTSATDAGDA